MRAALHGIAVLAALATFFVLEPSIRVGRTSILEGILAIVGAVFAAYSAIVVVLGTLSGSPPSKWRSIGRQLFGGNSARDR